MDELITIAFSHFCEKARWGLERAGHPFRETRTLPGFHLWPARRALRGSSIGRAERHSSRYSTPILVTPTGPISGSTEILRYADAALCEGSDVEAWVGRLDDTFGPHTRRIAYFFVFERPGGLRALAEANVSRWQSAPLRVVGPLLVRRLQRGLGATRDGLARSVSKVDAIVDEVAAQLGDGRPYLTGERFTAADLTFAALLAPLVLPEGYGAWLPTAAELGPEAEAIAARYRAHPAGRFALRMYAEHRRSTHHDAATPTAGARPAATGSGSR